MRRHYCVRNRREVGQRERMGVPALRICVRRTQLPLLRSTRQNHHPLVGFFRATLAAADNDGKMRPSNLI